MLTPTVCIVFGPMCKRGNVSTAQYAMKVIKRKNAYYLHVYDNAEPIEFQTSEIKLTQNQALEIEQALAKLRNVRNS